MPICELSHKCACKPPDVAAVTRKFSDFLLLLVAGFYRPRVAILYASGDGNHLLTNANLVTPSEGNMLRGGISVLWPGKGRHEHKAQFKTRNGMANLADPRAGRLRHAFCLGRCRVFHTSRAFDGC